MLKKSILGGTVILIGIIAGFIFLLRGCLAGYDERSAIPPSLYFEKEGKSVVFSLVNYGKATSYSSGPKGTFKSMSTNYYIQANDGITGELISNKKIKHHSDVKFYPIEILGAANNKAWVFIGEPLAYDPFTLEKFADKETIESKNPILKGKMPDDRRYYEFDRSSGNILITATDGMKYILSTNNLIATAINEDAIATNAVELVLKQLKKQEEALDKTYRNGFDRYRAFNKLYSEKKIAYDAYLDSGKNFNKIQDSISKMRTKIRDEMNELSDAKRTGQDQERQIENLERSSVSYSSLCTAVDTFDGKWYGLLNTEDLEKPETELRYRSVYNETARNKFYQATTSIKDSSHKKIELKIDSPEKISDAVYLQGGFLLNKKTALPIHLSNKDGFIVCNKDKVGNTGAIVLSRIDLDGKSNWSVNTRLTEFKDWIFTGNKLIILGNDNDEISSSNANLLLIINLQNGKLAAYDYFTNKMRKE